jgi:hypothetical protein
LDNSVGLIIGEEAGEFLGQLPRAHRPAFPQQLEFAIILTNYKRADMRNFNRPLVPCSTCGAKIYWEFSPHEKYDDDTVSSPGWRLPDVRANGFDVDAFMQDREAREALILSPVKTSLCSPCGRITKRVW